MRNLNIFVIKGSLNNNTKIDGNNIRISYSLLRALWFI